MQPGAVEQLLVHRERRDGGIGREFGLQEGQIHAEVGEGGLDIRIGSGGKPDSFGGRVCPGAVGQFEVELLFIRWVADRIAGRSEA